MAKCAMDLDCQAVTESQKIERRLFWIDTVREIVRNIIGLVIVIGVMWILYSFVVLSPTDDRKDVMFLVIGYLGGLATGVSTWYFGGAMRSALQQAREMSGRGGTINVGMEPTPLEPVPGVTTRAVNVGVSTKVDTADPKPGEPPVT